MFEQFGTRALAALITITSSACVGPPPKVGTMEDDNQGDVNAEDDDHDADTDEDDTSPEPRPPGRPRDAGPEPADAEPRAGAGEQGHGGSSAPATGGASGGAGSGVSSGGGAGGSSGMSGPASMNAGSGGTPDAPVEPEVAEPERTCPLQFREEDCARCFQNRCLSKCSDCLTLEGCSEALECFATCNGDACDACVANGSDAERVLDIFRCVTADCQPECLPRKLGDPCANGELCETGMCGALWCTRSCSSDVDCGTNSRGYSNVCGVTGAGDSLCFPGCTAQADCDAFPDTECMNIGGQRFCSKVELVFKSRECNACAYEYCSAEILTCSADSGCEQFVQCQCEGDCSNCTAGVSETSLSVVAAMTDCLNRSCVPYCGG